MLVVPKPTLIGGGATTAPDAAACPRLRITARSPLSRLSEIYTPVHTVGRQVWLREQSESQAAVKKAGVFFQGRDREGTLFLENPLVALRNS